MQAKVGDIYNHSTRVVASTLGALVGLAGIDHGIFEILQGPVTPSSFMIAAIGPDQRFWIFGEETALTIVPSFLISGILSVILGIIVTIWAIWFIDRKHGGWILLLLSVALFLVGGGFAPIFLAIIASLTATRIYKPLKFWRVVLPGDIRSFLAKIWLVVLISFVVAFVISVVIAIFGLPLTLFFDDETALGYLNSFSYLMVGLMLLSSLTGFAHDLQTQVGKSKLHDG
jgi:MFS family permease